MMKYIAEHRVPCIIEKMYRGNEKRVVYSDEKNKMWTLYYARTPYLYGHAVETATMRASFVVTVSVQSNTTNRL